MALLAMFLAAALFTVAVHVPCRTFVASGKGAMEASQPLKGSVPSAVYRQGATPEPLVASALRSLGSMLFLGSLASAFRARAPSGPQLGSKAKAVVRLQSSYQQAACSPEKPIVIEAHAGKDYIETVVVPEQPEILAESETAAQVITAPATSATFGRTAVKARMVQGARFRSARFAGQGPSISQRKQRRRVGARLRAVSAVYEMPPMPFDASRVRFQIQIGLNTNPRPRAPKARSQPVHESAERMVSAAELLRASYMCEERETLDTSSLACEARLLASAHRGAGAVAASR
ncbi:unnamed protein product [Symbiodinium microadriaticum]|nr:unnamed protein product [Symbiodinium microadriaticum]